MRNVFSVRPCVFGPSILAGWKKHRKNKGSPAKKNKALVYTGNGMSLSVECGAQACTLQLNKLKINSEVVAVLRISFCQEINPSSN